MPQVEILLFILKTRLGSPEIDLYFLGVHLVIKVPFTPLGKGGTINKCALSYILLEFVFMQDMGQASNFMFSKNISHFPQIYLIFLRRIYSVFEHYSPLISLSFSLPVSPYISLPVSSSLPLSLSLPVTVALWQSLTASRINPPSLFLNFKNMLGFPPSM